jgi:hypothetical protein
MIDIEQGALRPFEQNAPIGFSGLFQAPPNRTYKGKNFWCDFAQAKRDFFTVCFLDAHSAAKCVVMRQQLFDLRGKAVQIL